MVNISDLVGIPFARKGRSKEGFDCWGLAMEVFKRYGIDIPDYNKDSYNEEEIHKEVLKRKELEDWEEIKEPEVPCLVLFQVGKFFVSHVGVYIGGGKFIHVRLEVNCCVERLQTHKNSLRGFYRYVG